MKRGGSLSGAVSMVMIFCVLCLAVFATLTVSTAERERKLSQLTAERAAEYYAADAEAMEKAAAVKNGENPPGVTIWETETAEPGTWSSTAQFSVPLGEDQQLSVELSHGSGSDWKITRWQTEYIGSWQTDDAITIWDGGQ